MNKFSTRLLIGLVVMLCAIFVAQAEPTYSTSPSSTFIGNDSTFAPDANKEGISDANHSSFLFPILNTGHNARSVVGNFTLTLPDVTVDQGNMICLPMMVTDFDGILGMQFSVNYNTSALTYTGPQNFNTDLLGWNIGSVGNPTPGNLTFTWNDPLAGGVTLVDATTIVELCFTVAATINSAVSFSGTPTSIEVIDAAEQIVDFNSESSTVTVNGATGGSSDFTLILPDVTVDQGDMICLPMTVAGFTDILGMQFSVNYNASALTYTSAQSFHADMLGWNIGSVGNPTPGNLTFTWNDPLAAGVTLADGITIIELCFTVSGSNTSAVSFSGNPTTIEVIDAAEQMITFNSESSIVTVNGGGGGNMNDFTLSLPNITVDQGDMICLPMTVNNFTDILGMQFSVNYNASALSYTSAQSFHADMLGWNIGSVGNPTPGNLTFTWNDPLAAGVTLADGTTIIELCFTVSGSNTSTVSFSGNPTTIEVIDAAEQMITFNSESGTVTVNGTGGTGGTLDGFTLILSDQNVMNGDMICLPMTVHDFVDILGMQFSVNYDAAALTYTGPMNFNGDLLGWNIGSVGNPSAGNLTFTWNDPLAAGVTLANGTAIVELCFTVTGPNDSSTTLTFSGDPTTIEIIDSGENTVVFNSQSGTLTIGTVTNTPNITIELADLTTTMGSNICIPMTVTGFTDVVDMQMNVTYDNSILNYTGTMNFNASMAGWMASSITNPSAGNLSLAWNGASTTLGNGTSIVELCFNVVGASTSTVSITNPSVENNAAESFNVTTNNSTVTIDAPLDGFNLILPDQNVMNGDMICLPMTVHDFVDILGMQFSVNYDAAALTYTGPMNFNGDLLGWNIGSVGNPSAGNLTFTWNDPLAAGVTLANGTSIVELCFTVTGPNDSSTTLTFSGDPTTIEIIDSGENIVEFNSQSGTLTIGTVTNTPNITIELADLTTTMGSNICIPMTVTGFTDVVDMQMNVTYDNSILNYTGAMNFNASMAGWMASSITNPSAGNLSLGWNGASTTLGNGISIVELCFDVVGANTSNVSITNPSVENNATESFNVTTNNSTVTIDAPLDGFTLILPDQNVMNGDMICLPMTVHDFVDILGMQFSVNYDAAALTYTGAQTFNGDLLGWNIGSVGNPSAGNLTFTWNDPLATGATLANGTAIVELCFTVTGPNDSSTTLTFSGNPTTIEIIDSGENIVEFNSQSGTLTIGTVTNTPNITIELADLTTTMGSNICIPMTVTGFTDVVDMQMNVTYDNSILNYTGAMNFNASMAGWMASSITNPSAGNLSLVWNGASTTLGNGTSIVELCFDVVGASTSNVSITNPSVENNAAESLNVTTNNSTVTIETPLEGFTLSLPDQNVMNGEMICLPITVNDFTNIVGMQFSINYDETALTYTGPMNFHPDLLGWNIGSIGTNTLNALTFAWNDPLAVGVTLPDGTTIVELCFTVIGANGTSTTLSFSGDPTAIEIIDNNENPVEFNSQSGTLTINETPPPSITFTLGDTNGMPNDNICLPITVQGFDDVLGMQFSINYDASNLDFTGAQNINGTLLGLLPTSFVDNSPGNITFLWDDPQGLGISLADGAVIAEVCFDIIGNNASDVCFSGTPTAIEVVNGAERMFDFNGVCGTVGVNLDPPGAFVVEFSEQEACDGDNFCIDLTAVDISNIEGMEFSITYNTTDLNFTSITDLNTANLPGLTIGSFNTNTAGVISFDWQNSNNTGSSLMAGDVLFSICFSKTSDENTNIGIGGTPMAINIEDSNGNQVVYNGLTATITCDPIPILMFGQIDIVNLTCADIEIGSITVVNMINGVGPFTYTWGGAASTQGNVAMVTGLGASTIPLTVTDTNTGQSLDTVLNITSPPLLVGTVVSITNINCAGDNTGAITISASGGVEGAGYMYDWGGDLPDGVTTQSNLSQGTNYSVTITDANGCTRELNNIQVNELNTAFTISGIVSLIPSGGGGFGSINLTVGGGGGGNTYAWTGPNGYTFPNEDPDNITMPGEYTVLVTDTFGCTTTDTFTVYEALGLNIFDVTIACSGDSNGAIDITMAGGNCNESYTFEWTVAGTSTIISTMEDVNGLAPATYRVIASCGDDSVTLDFTVGENSAITLGGVTSPSTTGTNGNVNLTVDGGTEEYTFAWDSGQTSEDINNLAAGTYCVTVTDANNCTAEACYLVSASPLITASSTTDVSCFGFNDGDVIITVEGGVPPYSIVVDPAGLNLNISDLDNGIWMIDDTFGPGTYVFTATDAQGEMISGAFTIEEPEALALSNIVIVNDTEDNGGTGSISFGTEGGTGETTVAWNVGGLMGVPVFQLTGDITYSATIIDNNGCTLQEDFFVGQLAIADPGTLIHVGCENDQDGSITVNISGGLEPYTYQWSFDGSPIGGNEASLTGLAPGTYFLNIMDASGATMIRNYMITAQSNFAINATVLNGPSCSDSEDGSFQAIISNQGATTNFSYEWLDSNNSFIGTGETLTGIGGDGVYTLTVIDNDFMCEASTTVEFGAELPKPITLDDTVNLISCDGEDDGTITVSASGGTGSFTYEWSNGDSGSTTMNLVAGGYTVSVTDENNCQLIASFEIGETSPLLLLVETEDDTEDCNGRANAVVIGGTPPYSYDWTNVPGNPDIGLVLGLCFGNYQLVVTDSRGCTSALVQATVVNDLHDCFAERVVISPDGNGSNDEFVIFCIDRFLDSHLEIYNRWGQLVFETDNYQNDWEGTSQNDEDLPAGPYYWVLDYTGLNGSAQEMRGSLSIVRDN